jgi:signal peptidase I
VKDLLSLLATVLAWAAVPVLLLAAFDHFVLEPKRPRSPEDVPEPAPAYLRVANFLVPFVLIAAVFHIGVRVVFDWLKEVAVPLSWFAAPIGLWCAIDSWWLAPRRAAVAGTADVKDPPLVRAAYAVLPVLVVAVVIRMISAETLDFSLVLLLLSVATGAVWLVDHFVFRRRRTTTAEPGTVDYARSFFPVAFIVLIVRAFIFEPFRIPSDSMMPTLLDGDFIVVNKYAYGLRLPVLNDKFIDTGSPQRGDVVVFRYPPDPTINYIKRLVGLPGDRVEVRDDHLIVNGKMVDQQDKGTYVDNCYTGVRLSTETLGLHTHDVMSCHSPIGLQGAQNYAMSGNPEIRMACDRKEIARKIGGWVCQESAAQGTHDSNDYEFDVVPAGHYLMIGDNRDNSADSRVWGLVPDENLVGKATRIWFNFDSQRPSLVNWGRIGNGIQ